MIRKDCLAPDLKELCSSVSIGNYPNPLHECSPCDARRTATQALQMGLNTERRH